MTRGGEGRPARDDRELPPSRAGHIPCCICTGPIPLDEYAMARCWTDPHGVTCAAHATCLVSLGEQEIGLR
jgi:hypothetical protein